MSHATKVLAALFAIAAIGGITACGSSDDGGGESDTTAAATTTAGGKSGTAGGRGEAKSDTPTIVVRDGEPVGGVRELEYNAGDRVLFAVDSDVADEVHVHGYDVSKDVAAGGSVSFSFPAEIEGIFEVELEESQVPIAELRVNP